MGDNVRLSTWVTVRMAYLACTRKDVIRALSKASGVSRNTLESVDRGMRMGNYAKAKEVQDATQGEVTIKDLCE